jgi:acyl-CoA reductase-like NAD-dependent aldehyde dehydrogenase
MVRHHVPRKVSFTGSIAAGKHVAGAAAADLKRVTLELGGNDPAVLLDDVDIETVAKRIFWGAFTNCGQVCAAIKRVYVPRSRHDELVDALSDLAHRVRVGDGADDTTQIGPFNNVPQRERVEGLVHEAVGAGARVVAGGERLDGPGTFYRPTILADTENGMRVVDEEQFGPVLPVISTDSLDESIALANDSMFGLGASVWGTDLDAAQAVADRLEAGTTWINAHMVNIPEQPFSGTKWSGQGVENGPRGLEAYTELDVRYTRH